MKRQRHYLEIDKGFSPTYISHIKRRPNHCANGCWQKIQITGRVKRDVIWQILRTRIVRSAETKNAERIRHHGMLMTSIFCGSSTTPVILTGHMDGTITYKTITGKHAKPIAKVRLNESSVLRIIPEKNKDCFIVAHEAGILFSFDFAKEQTRGRYNPVHNFDAVNDFDIIDNTLATAADDKIVFFDVKSGKCQDRYCFSNLFNTCTCVRFGHGSRKNLLLVATSSGAYIFDRRIMTSPIFALNTSQGEKLRDAFWLKATQRYVPSFKAHASMPNSIQQLDEQYVLTSSYENEHKLWSLDNGQGICTLTIPGVQKSIDSNDTRFVSPIVAPSKRVIYSVDVTSNSIQEWNLSTCVGMNDYTPTRVLYEHRYPITCAALADDWSTLVLGDSLGKSTSLA